MPMHALRDALHFTQQQLAEELGIKQGSISKMERHPDHLVSSFVPTSRPTRLALPNLVTTMR